MLRMTLFVLRHYDAFRSPLSVSYTHLGVCWQIGELGKVDQGGGGTIAFMMSNWGAEMCIRDSS